MPLIILGIIIGLLDIIVSSAILLPLGISLILTGIFNIFISTSIILSCFVFGFSAIILYTITFIFINKSSFFNKNARLSNNDSLINKKCKVLEKVDDETYLVKANSELWTAISFNNSPLSEGDICIICSLEGVRLVIKKENI